MTLAAIERAAELAARHDNRALMGRAIEALGAELAARDPVTHRMLELDQALRSAAALRLGEREPLAVTSAAAASMRDLGSALTRVEPATTRGNRKLGRSFDLIGPERSEGPLLARCEHRERAHPAHAEDSPANRGKIQDLGPSDRGDRGEKRDDDRAGGRR